MLWWGHWLLLRGEGPTLIDITTSAGLLLLLLLFHTKSAADRLLVISVECLNVVLDDVEAGE